MASSPSLNAARICTLLARGAALLGALATLQYTVTVLRQYQAIRCPKKGFLFGHEGAPASTRPSLLNRLATVLHLFRRASSDVSLRILVFVGEVAMVARQPGLLVNTLRALRSASRRGVQYGPHPRQRYDVHEPAEAGAASARPVVVFVHGGAWAFGDSTTYAAFSRALSDATGGTVVTPSYRSYPAANAGGMADDVTDVMRHVAVGGRRVLLVGHSAGAQLCAMALLRLAEEGTTQTGGTDPSPDVITFGATPPSARRGSLLLASIVGFVGLSGVYHIADHYAFEAARRIGIAVDFPALLGRGGGQPLFIGLAGVATISPMAPACGGPPGFDAHSPAVLLEAATPAAPYRTLLPPVYLLHGDTDGTVPASSSIRFATALAAHGCGVSVVVVPGGGHADGILALSCGEQPPAGAVGSDGTMRLKSTPAQDHVVGEAGAETARDAILAIVGAALACAAADAAPAVRGL